MVAAPLPCRIRKLSCFLNLAVTDARSAGAKPLIRPLHNRANSLQIHVPASIRHVVGVADFMSELRALAAYIANSCHFLKAPEYCVRSLTDGAQTPILAQAPALLMAMNSLR